MSNNEAPALPVKDLIDSVIRTIIPYIVGLVVALVAKANITLDDSTIVQITGVVTLLVGTIYYIIVRWAEQKWPQVGWFLGVPKQPVYVDNRTVPGTVVVPEGVVDVGDHEDLGVDDEPEVPGQFPLDDDAPLPNDGE